MKRDFVRSTGPFIATAIFLAASHDGACADMEAGRTIVHEVCQQCHGLDGMALIDEAPNLAGQKRSYIARQLWAFRSGERTDPKMSPSAIGLSDEDIANVAEWYALIEVSVKPPE